MVRRQVVGATAAAVSLLLCFGGFALLLPERGTQTGSVRLIVDVVESICCAVGMLGVMTLLKYRALDSLDIRGLVRLGVIVSEVSLLANLWIDVSGMKRNEAPAQLILWLAAFVAFMIAVKARFRGRVRRVKGRIQFRR